MDWSDRLYIGMYIGSFSILASFFAGAKACYATLIVTALVGSVYVALNAFREFGKRR